jgi:tagatose 6-phosphate kinase
VILTVTLNPAWDVTYPVGVLDPGATHRVTRPAARAGGKGINVARVLTRMGEPALATGVLLGHTGLAVRDDLAQAGVRTAFADGGGGGNTRCTVTIVEAASGRATLLNEPGPGDGDINWPALRDHLLPLIARCAVLVLSGSLPPALPVDAYADLVEAGRHSGATTILDSDGPALAAALAARPDIVKPSQDEMARVTGIRDPHRGAAALLDAGAGAVVVSAGPDGLHAVTRGESYCARPPELTAVNPTGAGDAVVAGLASGLLRRAAWPELVRVATAWSAASVLEPVAGEVSPAEVARLAGLVNLQPCERNGMPC